MNTIINLLLSKTEKLKIVVPNFKKKENLFYPITLNPHIFDIGCVEYISKNSSKKIIIGKDTLDEILLSLNVGIKNLATEKLSIPSKLQGNLGFFYAVFYYKKILTYNRNFRHTTFPYDINIILTIANGPKMFFYNSNEKMYLEIAPSFNFYSSSTIKEKKKQYKEFIANYAPLAVIEIDEKKLIKCQQQIQELSDKLQYDHTLYYKYLTELGYFEEISDTDKKKPMRYVEIKEFSEPE